MESVLAEYVPTEALAIVPREELLEIAKFAGESSASGTQGG
jgi:hypothetical protein